MKIFNTKHQQKSAIITAILLFLLIFGILNYGMQYLDPPKEYGLAINFGDANVGSGEPVVKTKTTKPKVVKKKEEVVEKVVEEVKETSKEIIKEEIITTETSKEVPIVEKVQEEKKEPVKEIIKKIPTKKPTPKPSKETQDALSKLLNSNSSDIGKPKGEGDTKVEGVKGKKEGNATSSKYYGNTGNNSGGNYNLTGRKALSKPKEQPDCQEEGVVVVKITVNKEGKVISAIPGIKGSTNTASCLLKPAKIAALSTQWNADKDAPQIQTGTIIYKFSLSK